MYQGLRVAILGAKDGGFWVRRQKVYVEKVYVLFPSLSMEKADRGISTQRALPY